MKTVYLAGSITGLSYAGATSWREHAIKELAKVNIRGLSPLRCKEYLANEKSIFQSYEDFVLSTGKGITTRDRWDATRCDVLLANLLGAKTVSIGTVMEIAWADSRRTPIVVVMEPDNIHQHAMLKEVSGFIVETLESGLDVAKSLLV